MNITSEETRNKEKPRLEIGVIGHVDHGKTTLTSTISQVASDLYKLSKKRSYESIDNALEEVQRGITINASHVPIETDLRRYSLIDCPGHKDYIKNMITGAFMMNGAIVVISIGAGVAEQTKEHLRIVGDLGIKNLIVYLNDHSSSGITEDDKEIAKLEVESSLENYGFNPQQVPILFGSALKAKQGSEEEVSTIKKMLEILDNFPLPESSEDKPFLMYVGSKHKIEGIGLVVTGIVQQGTLKKNDELEFFSLETSKVYNVKVRSMQVFNKEIQIAYKNEDLAVNLSGDLKIEEATRGSLLAAKGTMKFNKKFVANIYLLSKSEEGRGIIIENGYRPQFFIYTANITGEIILPEGEILNPELSEAQKIKIELERPFPLRERDKVIIMEGKGKRSVVGSGFIEEIIE